MGMVVTILVLLLVLAALAYPYWKPPLLAFESSFGPASRVAELEHQKQALYGAIRDVGFDLRTDKIGRQDYSTEVAVLKAQAVEIIAEIETLRSSPPRGPGHVEALVDAARARLADSGHVSASSDAACFCTGCGRAAADSDRFCAGCGAALREGA